MTRLRSGRYRQKFAEEHVAGSVRRIRQLSTPQLSFVVGGGGTVTAPPLARGMSQPLLSHDDLWDIDEKAKDTALQGVVPPPDQIDLTGGPAFGVARRRRVRSDLSGIMNACPTVEERLGGYVRRDMSKDTRRRQHRAQPIPRPPPMRRRQTSDPTTMTSLDRQTTYPPMTSFDRHTTFPPMPTLGEDSPTVPPVGPRASLLDSDSSDENE